MPLGRREKLNGMKIFPISFFPTWCKIEKSCRPYTNLHDCILYASPVKCLLGWGSIWSPQSCYCWQGSVFFKLDLGVSMGLQGVWTLQLILPIHLLKHEQLSPQCPTSHIKVQRYKCCPRPSEQHVPSSCASLVRDYWVIACKEQVFRFINTPWHRGCDNAFEIQMLSSLYPGRKPVYNTKQLKTAICS